MRLNGINDRRIDKSYEKSRETCCSKRINSIVSRLSRVIKFGRTLGKLKILKNEFFVARISDYEKKCGR